MNRFIGVDLGWYGKPRGFQKSNFRPPASEVRGQFCPGNPHRVFGDHIRVVSDDYESAVPGDPVQIWPWRPSHPTCCRQGDGIG